MSWFCCVLLVSAGLAIQAHNHSTPNNSPREPPTPLFPISLGPISFADEKRVNRDCKVPMRHDGYLWHRLHEGLWFQATGYLEVEEDEYTPLSNRLECDVGCSSCTLTISSVASITASEMWGETSSTTVGFRVELEEILTLEAAKTSGTEHSITASVTTSAETSYSCTIDGNLTVHLAARLQYYLVFGYVSEYMIVKREFYIDGNGDIRERHYWGWEESCNPLFRIPKVLYDGSIAGTRRCVVEAFPNSSRPIVTIV